MGASAARTRSDAQEKQEEVMFGLGTDIPLLNHGF